MNVKTIQANSIDEAIRVAVSAAAGSKNSKIMVLVFEDMSRSQKTSRSAASESAMAALAPVQVGGLR